MIGLYSSARLIYRAHRYRLKLEPAEVSFVRRHAEPGSTVVDIGAHKGGFTYWMSRATGPGGRVVAFEPQPELAGQLRRVFGSWRNVTVEDMGVSDRSGTMTLFVPGSRSSPSASFEQNKRTAGAGRRVPVSVTTLDLYLAGPRPRVSLIKCDAEGHELQVFRGARGTIERERPALIFECEKRHLPGQEFGEVFDYISAFGYRGFFFAPAGLRPLADFDPVRDQDRPGRDLYCNNFAFLPEERLESKQPPQYLASRSP